MKKRGKRHSALLDKAVGEERQTVAVAVDLLHQMKSAKFDETVELAMKWDIDPKQADQLVRGSYSLPNGTGKAVKIIAFCEGEVAEKATAAGAIEVGGEELAKKIQDGWMGFDIAIAHPSMMRHVGKLGRVLGPQGKMSSPKAGTVVEAVGQAVTEFKAGKIEFRNDAGGNLHAVMGRRSFDPVQIKENVEAFLEHVVTMKPTTAKGNFVLGAHIAGTMSPGIELSVG